MLRSKVVEKKNKIKKKISFFQSRKESKVILNLTNNFIYAYLIDLSTGNVIKSMSTKTLDGVSKSNVEASKQLGDAFGDAIKGLEKASNVFFDRTVYQYHGKVKAFVEQLRIKGIKV